MIFVIYQKTHDYCQIIDSLKDGELAIIIDCGKDDFFVDVNRDLHKVLLEKNIDHDFILRPGIHNYKYWQVSIDYQLLFFRNFFKNNSIGNNEQL